MLPTVYLDYNATTAVDPRVVDAMLPFFTQYFGNASSKTHAAGWQAAHGVDKARLRLAQLLGCEAEELLFTSGATEAIGLALRGVWAAYRKKGNHIVTCVTEHPAVLETCHALEKEGAVVTYLPVDQGGHIVLADLKAVITKDTILVALMGANNETGTLHPLQEIGEITRANGVLFFSDATQLVGKVRIDLNALPVDLLACSAHKFYGPKGVGALFVRRKLPRVNLLPVQVGGGQERGLRAGTLNVTGIVGMGMAAEIAGLEIWDDNQRLSVLRHRLEQALLTYPGATINGSFKHRLTHVTNVQFPGLDVGAFLKKLPWLQVSLGAACASGKEDASHVLMAMGLSKAEAKSSLRFSLGRFTTEQEIEQVVGGIGGFIR